ncbi:hypothetical protein [Listeria seeligeri]|uniref:hypothetical protein n=1 Tax=Listeria seeligeri TaxID=1640 RepID=UPI0022EA5392|nr:hypothetical protein [Listeria seeligeri]
MMNANISEMKAVEIKLVNTQFISKQLDIYENTKGMYHSTDKQLLNSNEQESVIQLYKTAVKALKQANVKPSKQIKHELHRQVQSLQNQQEQLYEKHKECKKIQKQDRIIEQNLMQLFKLNHTKKADREH